MKAEFITEDCVKQTISVNDIVMVTEQTYRWLGEDKIETPSKITTDAKRFGVPSWINAMPAYVAPLDALGLKWAGGFDESVNAGGPYIKAVVITSKICSSIFNISYPIRLENCPVTLHGRCSHKVICKHPVFYDFITSICNFNSYLIILTIIPTIVNNIIDSIAFINVTATKNIC